ncbi:Lipoprotein OS=Streptomyces tendae OX=1932 GN=F3L20_03990 PE=4 SV=1 [Streptomyces tendae]
MAETRRRLRSSTVVLGGMGVLAAALSACGSDPDRRCVDRDSYDYLNGYKVVADKNCKSGSSGSSTGKGRKTSRATDGDWYYDADVSNGWADSGTFSRSEAVDRGGFGCSGSGSGGG